MEHFKEMKVESMDSSNKVLGFEPIECKDVTVEFSGRNNILYLEEGVRLGEGKIRFLGDNALVYLSKSRNWFNARIDLETNAAVVIGRNIFFNASVPLAVRCRENSSFVLGNDSLLSLSILIDTATENRGNQSILIGQHVWLGQRATIKGGTIIRSGAIIGSDTEINGQRIPEGTCWAERNGQLQKLYDNIVFTRQDIQNAARADLNMYDTIDNDYLRAIQRIMKKHWRAVLETVESVPSAEERLSLLLETADRRRYKRPKQKVKKEKSDRQLGENRVIGASGENNPEVTFHGIGNRLIIEEGAILVKSRFVFNGDNSLIYISKGTRPCRLRVTMNTDTTLYVGRDCRTKEAGVAISVSEAQSILIGNRCRMDSGIWLRTSDMHPIYDQATRKRLNPPKSVLVGDDVTLPHNALIFKGRKIGIKKGLFRSNVYERTLKRL